MKGTFHRVSSWPSGPEESNPRPVQQKRIGHSGFQKVQIHNTYLFGNGVHSCLNRCTDCKRDDRCVDNAQILRAIDFESTVDDATQILCCHRHCSHRVIDGLYKKTRSQTGKRVSKGANVLTIDVFLTNVSQSLSVGTVLGKGWTSWSATVLAGEASAHVRRYFVAYRWTCTSTRRILALDLYISIWRAQRTPWDGKKVGINRWSSKWITTIDVLPKREIRYQLPQNAE